MRSCSRSCTDNAVHSVLPKDSLGEAVHYALKHWTALTKFTEAGHLDASNSYAERCMRAIADGRKAFLFVVSERARLAAAIYCSVVESCKANKIHPLTYLTHILAKARDKALRSLTLDEFATCSTTPAGKCVR